MLVQVRENVAKLKERGETVDQVIAAKPTAAFDATMATFPVDAAFFTRLVYRGV